MSDPTIRLLEAAQTIAHEVATNFIAGGGRVLVDGDEISPEDVSSPSGALGPLLLWAGDYTRGQGVRFAWSSYARDERALAGYRPLNIQMSQGAGDESKDASAETILAFSHFLRKVCFNLDNHLEVDLTPVCDSFRAWCQLYAENHPEAPAANSTRSPD
jgi:hypothetical protein